MRYALFLALREARTSLPRIGPYMLSIALGVAALVSIHSFRQDVSRSVREEARVLMGADVRLSGNAAPGSAVRPVLDSLDAAGNRSALVTSAVSMARGIETGVPEEGRLDPVRLVQLRAVKGGWPFYGEVVVEPEGVWGRHLEPGRVLVDEAILTQMAIAVGDSVAVGAQSFEVVGAVRQIPTELGLQTAIGPRIWMSTEDLQAAGVGGEGSLVRYATYLVVPALGNRAAIETRYEEVFRGEGVRFATAEEEARDLTEAVGFLGRYLALVGLAALLLGGIGVGSAIHVFVRERLPSVAVLRCLGARQNGVFLTYLLQAAGLGLLGSALGAAVGVGIQQLLPQLLTGLLPVTVQPRIDPVTILAGIGVGVWVSLVFGLLPLLTIREVPPLRALRSSLEEGPAANRWLQALALALLAASVVGTSVLEAPTTRDGVTFAVALTVAVGVLWAGAWATVRVARFLVPGSAPWAVRQGVSNLFRPGNQTIPVVIALGFGSFLVGTLGIVQQNLADSLALEDEEGAANLLLFDIQSDQREGIAELLPDSVRRTMETTPIVPGQIAGVRGVLRASLDSLPRSERPARWALRREYRNSWRSELSEGEALVEGAWWDEAPPAPEGAVRISLEVEVADDLRVGVGDRVLWSLGGQEVETVITSLRTVDWGRFETNFYVLFEPGSIDDAPATWVALMRGGDSGARSRLQGEVVRRYPNVSIIDLGRIQDVVNRILGNVDRAISFLALFAAFAGLLVLAGSLAATRGERVRESALLRTLGADRSTVLRILSAEYAVLGLLSAGTGLLLGTGGAFLVVTQIFELPFRPGIPRSLLLLGGVVLLTLGMGLLGSRDLLRRPPLPILRGTD